MLYEIDSAITAFSTERRTQDIDQPYAGFNVTPYVGDSPSRIGVCQRQLAKYLHIPVHQLIIPHQVHGNRMLVVDQSLLQRLSEDTFKESQPEDVVGWDGAYQSPLLDGYDALLTNLPEVCIGVSTADCVPLLFYDTRTRAMAVAHAGWRGTVLRIGVLTLARMYEVFGSRGKDVLCVIGPSIGPRAFEVNEDVFDAFRLASFPMEQIAHRLLPADSQVPRRWCIDLWKANAWQLQEAGIPPQNISITGICTYTDYNRFFSARRLGINSGRIFSGILRRQ